MKKFVLFFFSLLIVSTAFVACSNDDDDDDDDKPKEVTYKISYELKITTGDASSYSDMLITYTDADGQNQTVQSPDFPWKKEFDGIKGNKTFALKMECTQLKGKDLGMSGSVSYTGSNGSFSSGNISFTQNNPEIDLPVTRSTNVTTPSE